MLREARLRQQQSAQQRALATRRLVDERDVAKVRAVAFCFLVICGAVGEGQQVNDMAALRQLARQVPDDEAVAQV